MAEPGEQRRGGMTLRLIQLGLGRLGTELGGGGDPRHAGVAPVAWVEIDPAARERAMALLGLPPERLFGSLDEALQARGGRCRADHRAARRARGGDDARRSRQGCTSWSRSRSPRPSPRRSAGRARPRTPARAHGQPELPLVPGGAAGAPTARGGRDRPAARLLPRLPFPVRHRLSLLLPGRAAAQRHGDPSLRHPALRAAGRAGGRDCQSWSEPESPFKAARPRSRRSSSPGARW